MERSFAARLPLTRGLGRGIRRPSLGRLAALAGALCRQRRAHIALSCAALALALLGGGWLWLRGSSLVAVERVQVAGVARGPERGAIEGALRATARRMTTLDFSSAALREAVAAYPVVRSLQVRTSFPHGVRISVEEQPPVAQLQSGGWRTAVAADGVVLGTGPLEPDLPTIDYGGEPAPRRLARGAEVRAMLTLIGAAPGRLAARVARLSEGAQGLTAAMRNGLQVYFGDARDARAKWAALARVLADPSSAGASYIDVRLPERPAAGFPDGGESPPVTGAGTAGEDATSAQVGGSEATIGALAEQLREGTGSGLAAQPQSQTESQTSSQQAGASDEAAAAGQPGVAATSQEGEQTGQVAAGEQGASQAPGEPSSST